LKNIKPIPDGRKVALLTNKVPLLDKENNVIGILGIYYDVTERKRMEEELRLAMKSTEAANHGLTLMTGSVVHELRTPLVSVNLAISAIEQYLPELISAYQLASDNGLLVKKIGNSDLPMLVRFAQNIQTEIKAANTFIDTLLLNLTEPKISAEKMHDCSIRQCIEMALERYPLGENVKNKIIFEAKDDFILYGEPAANYPYYF